MMYVQNHHSHHVASSCIPVKWCKLSVCPESQWSRWPTNEARAIKPSRSIDSWDAPLPMFLALEECDSPWGLWGLIWLLCAATNLQRPKTRNCEAETSWVFIKLLNHVDYLPISKMVLAPKFPEESWHVPRVPPVDQDLRLVTDDCLKQNKQKRYVETGNANYEIKYCKEAKYSLINACWFREGDHEYLEVPSHGWTRAWPDQARAWLLPSLWTLVHGGCGSWSLNDHESDGRIQ